MLIDSVAESEYVFSDRYPSRDLVYKRIDEASRATRAIGLVELDLPYGEHERERIDLFAGDAGRPLLVFIHGGYWRSQHKDAYSFVANELRWHGVSVAVLGYPLAPDVRLQGIVDSLRRAMAWLAGPGNKHLPPISETVVAGYSAGGQLAALLASESSSDPSVEARVSGCLALSGLFDLQPLVRTSIGARIGLDEASAQRLSPLNLPAGNGWLIAAVGEKETAAFQSQTNRYAEHWSAAGRPVTSLSIPGADHYSILLQLADSGSPVLQALLARLNVAHANPGGARER